VGRIEFHHARRDTAGLYRFIDGGENNVAVPRDMNDYAAAGKICDDLVLGRLRLRGCACVQAHRGRKECKAASKPKGMPQMIVPIHYSYIVRPEAIKAIPGIIERQSGSDSMLSQGAASSLPGCL